MKTEDNNGTKERSRSALRTRVEERTNQYDFEQRNYTSASKEEHTHEAVRRPPQSSYEAVNSRLHEGSSTVKDETLEEKRRKIDQGKNPNEMLWN